MLAKMTNKKDKEMYQDLIFSDTVKFLVLVLNTNEEKNQGSRYVGQIDLESNNLSEATPFGGEMMQQQSKTKKTAGFKTTPKDSNSNDLDEIMGSQLPPKKAKTNQKSAAESAASATTPTPEDSKRKGGRGKNAKSQ